MLFILKLFVFIVYVFVLLHVLYVSFTISWPFSFPKIICVSVGEGTIKMVHEEDGDDTHWSRLI